MIKSIDQFYSRFPRTSTVRFAKPSPRLSGWYTGELTPDGVPTFEYIEVPIEIARDIFETAWRDALSAAVRSLHTGE